LECVPAWKNTSEHGACQWSFTQSRKVYKAQKKGWHCAFAPFFSLREKNAAVIAV
jgi:hypothetical protein